MEAPDQVPPGTVPGPDFPERRAAYEEPVFNVIKSTLEYPADAQVVGAKLAEDIVFLEKATDRLDIVWTVFLEFVNHTPPNHPWQAALVQCMHALARREDRAEHYYRHDPEVRYFFNFAFRHQLFM